VEPPLPHGYALRPASPGDFPAIVGVIAACDLEDFGEVDVRQEWVRDAWRRPRFSLEGDTWVAEAAGGAVVAYAQVWDEDVHTVFDAEGWVHPRHRGRGLGTCLARAVERRALLDVALVAAGSAPAVHQSVDARVDDASALFARLGYREVRRFRHMEIDLGPGIEGGAPPGGIRIRGRREEDDPAIHAALEEAFAAHWGFVPVTYGAWRADERGGSAYDPSLWLVACDGDEVVGAMLGRVVAGHGWIGDLAVRSTWRGRGIGEALLRDAFRLFAERGVGRAMLNVDADNATGATRLYERAGMRVRREWLVLAKTLTSAA
jgi:mycothiol synthase